MAKDGKTEEEEGTTENQRSLRPSRSARTSARCATSSRTRRIVTPTLRRLANVLDVHGVRERERDRERVSE
jgi:hypothetical protein